MEPILGAAPRTQAWKAYVLLLNYIGIILGKYLIFPNLIFINVGRVSGTRTHTTQSLNLMPAANWATTPYYQDSYYIKAIVHGAFHKTFAVTVFQIFITYILYNIFFKKSNFS